MNIDAATDIPATNTLLDCLASLQSSGKLPIHEPSLAFRIHTGREPSPGESEYRLRGEVKKGDLFSAVTLGARLINDDGILQNIEEGERLLRNAAENGNVLAQIRLAAHLLSGRRLTQDRDRALLWLRRASATTPAQIGALGSYLWGKSVAAHRLDAPLLAEDAAVLCEEAIRQGFKQAGMILAYLIRRGEITAEARPSLDDLLSPYLEKNQPFALANQALRLARGIQCPVDWAQADAVFDRIPTSEEIFDWWYARSRENDAEGHLVVGWLDRYTLAIDPDGLGAAERFELAKQDGWTPPDWIMGRLEGALQRNAIKGV